MIWFILPAYNEGANLHKLLDNIHVSMRDINRKYKVIVVDDGSTDDTYKLASDLANDLPIEIVKHPVNMNLGATLRDGLLFIIDKLSNGDIVITMDADNTHNPNISPLMISRIETGQDLVIASRYVKGGKEIGLAFYRHLFSKIINTILYLFYPIDNIRDYTCGYRAYSAKMLLNYFNLRQGDLINEEGFTCMAEILLKMRPVITSASEVPLVLRYDLKVGKSKMKVFKTIMAYFRLIGRSCLRQYSFKGISSAS